ncbi:putative RNA recognition motif domain, nucleotide-binding alpha-beta plait domain superfamily [Dioscorea sansibarensis]
MRTVFCGNFDFDTRHADLERLFSRYGRVSRVDMKSGIFCFVLFVEPWLKRSICFGTLNL